mgnify:FL=1
MLIPTLLLYFHHPSVHHSLFPLRGLCLHLNDKVSKVTDSQNVKDKENVHRIIDCNQG